MVTIQPTHLGVDVFIACPLDFLRGIVSRDDEYFNWLRWVNRHLHYLHWSHMESGPARIITRSVHSEVARSCDNAYTMRSIFIRLQCTHGAGMPQSPLYSPLHPQVEGLEKQAREHKLALDKEYVSRKQVEEMESLFATAVEGLSNRLGKVETCNVSRYQHVSRKSPVSVFASSTNLPRPRPRLFIPPQVPRGRKCLILPPRLSWSGTSIFLIVKCPPTLVLPLIENCWHCPNC